MRSPCAAPGRTPLSPDLVDRFVAGSLPAGEWTHEAHLVVAHALLAATGDVTATVDRLRVLIPAHNDRVGLLPGRHGYHETLTRYYVGAVAAAGPGPVDHVLRDPGCGRDAPARHWSAARLATNAARVGWVVPDLAPHPRADPPPTPAAHTTAPRRPPPDPRPPTAPPRHP